ncbi:MAG TPA: hypothetical protein PKE64_15305 [Anaerolineae bacterium]|nr:hypothetical protein [Anaerolineae bacterium]HMR65373.1 hypothetical protein [Anaerolineae bacterium]
MQISLIGMSGTGKSHWSSQLAKLGFKRFCCDDLIAAKLNSALIRPDGTRQSMGEWMGFPYESQYRACEAKYLAYEAAVLEEILSYMATPNPAEKIVIDTTGSVIYMAEPLLHRLQQHTTMVYLDTPLEVQEKMRLAYCTNPPPVIWLDHFKPQPGETNQAALARCYPELLASRTSQYKLWADVSLDYYLLRQSDFSVRDFLREINRVQVP